MGVLTHLDMFQSQKTLRKTKKRLKNRFWTEIYQVCPPIQHTHFSEKHVYCVMCVESVCDVISLQNQHKTSVL